MASKGFELKPVSKYDGAHYPMEREGKLIEIESPDSIGSRRLLLHPSLVASLILLVGLGLIACVGEEKISFRDDKEEQSDGDTPDPGDDCEGEGFFGCKDEDSGISCMDGIVEEVKCLEYCGGEDSGVLEAYCDENSEEFCVCEYPVADGDISECSPGEVFCSGDWTASICNESEVFEARDCNRWCIDTYGEFSVSYGCDAEAEEVCQCGYDQTVGVMTECIPDELYCEDEQTLMVCDEEGYEFEAIECRQYCQEKFGIEYYSLGCDDGNAENPCLCEYDIIDGDVAECTPGEAFCSGDYEIDICNDDAWSYRTENCNEYCWENYGPDYASFGCDDERPENICNCEYDIVEGEPVECFVGEQLCADSYNVMLCKSYDDNDPDNQGMPGWWASMSCDEYCMENFGPEYYSPLGCQQDDPDSDGSLCYCEYGMVDGMIGGECIPGEAYCDPDDNLVLCEGDDYYGWWYTHQCSDVCAETGQVSQGCDDSDAGNYCMCGDEDEEN